MTDKIYLTKNDKIIKTDKKQRTIYMIFFSSIVENLDIKRYEMGSDSFIDNTTDPTLKAMLKYR